MVFRDSMGFNFIFSHKIQQHQQQISNERPSFKLVDLNYFKSNEDAKLKAICAKIDELFKNARTNDKVTYLIINSEFLKSRTLNDLIQNTLYPGSGEIGRPGAHFVNDTSSANQMVNQIRNGGGSVLIFYVFKNINVNLAESLECLLLEKLSDYKDLENVAEIDCFLGFLDKDEYIYFLENILNLALYEFLEGNYVNF